MIPFWFIFIAAGMRLIGGFAYLRATLIGEARPNPLSWLLWGITPLIAFSAELSAGVGLVSVVTLALGISPLMVFSVAVVKNPKSFKLDGFNIACAALALAGIILWQSTSQPELAITLAIAADIASGLPTIRKTIFDPYSEYAPTYLISAFSMIITLFAIKDWSFAAYAFPSYILTINSLMVSLIIIGRLVQKRRKIQAIKRNSKKRKR